MTFYNRKEEVIELTLTKFGKQLYSDGKLKPVYYAFYDDDILYDADHGGISETPSTADTRIKRSARLRPLPSNIGTERLAKMRKMSRQASGDKRGLLEKRIGTSDTLTDYHPSWNVGISSAKISSNTQNNQTVWRQAVGSSTRLTVEEENIPQINIQDLKCKIKAVETPDRMAKLYGKTFANGDALTIDMSEGELLISISEENSPETFENFDIELFEIEEVIDDRLSPPDSTDTYYREELRPLFFERQREEVVDDILRTTKPSSVVLRDNPEYASYFFNVELDGEIPRNVLREAFPGQRPGGKGNLRGRNNNRKMTGITAFELQDREREGDVGQSQGILPSQYDACDDEVEE